MMPDNPNGYPNNYFIKSPKSLYSRAQKTLSKGRVSPLFFELEDDDSSSECAVLESNERSELARTLNYLCRPKLPAHAKDIPSLAYFRPMSNESKHKYLSKYRKRGIKALLFGV